MGDAHRIGIIGLGTISRAYLTTLAPSERVRITALADLDRARADATAAEFGGRATSVDELLAADDVDTVLNLTIPAAHAEIAQAALAHGKQVYGEKPLAVTFADAAAVMSASTQAGIRVGSAPDTVLGTGLQTARAVVDSGRIGRPTAAAAIMTNPGPEPWHPSPDFYYQPGGGPLLDMGPYYVSALIQLLGPVRSVIGASSRLRTQRVIGSGERAGVSIPVDVDTHIAGILEHVDGAISTLTTSFDGVATSAPPIEVQGEEGALLVPDPNMFSGDVRLRRLGEPDWSLVDAEAGYVDAQRGAGLIDFVTATADRPARAGGDLALHVLEVMTGILRSAQEGRRVDLTTSVERPALVPLTPLADWR